MSSLGVRSASAAVFVPAMLALVWAGGWPLELAVLAASLTLWREMAALLGLVSARPLYLGGAAATALLCLAQLGLAGPHLGAPAGLALGAVLLLALALAEPGSPEQVLAQLAGAVLAVVWCGGLLPTLVSIRRVPEVGRALALAVLITTWAQDTGAYFVGRACGRRRLAPRWSPNKTVEGAGGGLWAALGAALVARTWGGLPLTALAAAGLGAIVWAAGILGDLAESMAKRARGVKDSGQLIPGHGGLLDRLDALLFSAPAAYVFWRAVAPAGLGG